MAMTDKEIQKEISLILLDFPIFHKYKSGPADLYSICNAALLWEETQEFFEKNFPFPEALDTTYKWLVIAKYFGRYKLLLEYLE